MDLTPLEALRALGITDDEIRARAEWLNLTAEELDKQVIQWMPESKPLVRLNAAIIRAAEQLRPELTPVTRETPGNGETRVSHLAFEHLGRWLIGWTQAGEMVCQDQAGRLFAFDPDGWYVVEGDR